MSSLRHAALAGVMWNLAGTVSQTLLQAGQFLVLAHYLSPSDYGVAGMAFVVVGFLQVFQDMGFSAILIQRPNLEPIQQDSLWWLNVGMGFVILCGLAAVSGPIVSFYNMPELRAILIAFGLNFLVISFGLQYAWLAERDLRFGILAKSDVASAAAGAVLSIVLAIGGAGVWSIVWGGILQGGLRTTILLVDGLPRWRPSLRFSWSSLSDIRSFGALQMGERTMNYFNGRIDQMLLGRLLDAASFGLYTFGFNLATKLSDKINPVVVRVAFPVLSKLQDEPLRRKALYFRMVHSVTSVNALAHFLFIGLAPTLVTTLFRGKWDAAVPAMLVIAGTYLMRCIGNPVGSLALSAGRADLTFGWNLVAFFGTPLAVGAGAWIGSLYSHEMMGVALALLMTQILYFWPAYRMMIRPVLGGCFLEYVVLVAKPITAGFACWAASAGAVACFREPVLAIGAGLVAGTTAFVAASLLVDRKRFADILDLARGWMLRRRGAQGVPA